MLRIVFIILILFSTFTILIPIQAQEETESTESANLEAESNETDPTQESIERVKDVVASRVAELDDSVDIYSGFISALPEDDDQITLTLDGVDYDIEIDQELLRVYRINNSSYSDISLEQLKEQDFVLALGTEINGTISASELYVDTRFEVLMGTITFIDEENFFFEMITLDRTEYTIDVENATNQQILNIKTVEIENGDFSQMKEGDTIHVVVKVFGQGQESVRFPAQKTMVIPQEFFIKEE